MSAPSSLRLLALDIRLETDVILCRQRARQLAEALGFDAQEQTHVATAVSEVVRNAFDYAQGGKIEFAVETGRPPRTAGRPGGEEQSFVVTVRDQGPGIPPVGERPPSGGLGVGLAGAGRLMGSLDIDTKPGATSVTLRKPMPKRAPLTAPKLQAIVDRIASEPIANPVRELQLQNQELLRALDEVHTREEDLARVNRELAETNSGVLALYDELETLHRVGVLLASQLDLKTLLQAIMDATTDLTNADFGAFFHRDEPGRAWRLQTSSGAARGVLDGLPFNGEADFFGPEFAARAYPQPADEPAVSPCGESKFARALDGRYELKSCLTIPVASETHLLGAMVFGSATAGAFTERSERIVSSIAAQAVVGIEKAELFASVRDASAAKDRFLAMLSHELRTPLNPVLAVVSNLVEEPDLPHDLRRDLELVLRNVRLEARLIDDLLDFSRVISGKLRLHRAPQDLHAIIRSAVDICAEDLARDEHVLTLELHAVRTTILGDSTRLQQAFWNVLKNAVKFTPKGGSIDIRTAVVDGDVIEVKISDTGVGVKVDVLPRIFGAFEQAGSDTAGKFGGLGLGLAITKAAVELHEGSIRATSAGLDQGTQITVRLPLLPQEIGGGTSTIPAPVAAGQENNAGTLLVVDDHADTLGVMSRLLTRRGYRVLTAVSCEAAIDTARRNRFDLIVSDLGLPDGSGLDLLARLREFYCVPAVALSGYGMDEDMRRSREAGYDAHLTKPIDFPLLLAAVGRLLAAKSER